ncbi:DUF6243 family protein [Streptomyces indicus]|uniref:Uncharacterized protein n=1 Tax=Streptomyces indicus TaxID=417292 RepID=A0A1G9D9F8_9ACTN|nr:DUF6243 family protein [Streptomyces indicus]SDK60552.1 hypothetical protein SAMN05421806_10997 [Streptomyces indicus]
MAKSRNNLLGVGGQRKKLSRKNDAGLATSRANDRKSAEELKQELVRKMQERSQGAAQTDDAPQEGTDNS